MPKVSALNAAHRARSVLWDAPSRWLGPRVHDPTVPWRLGIAALTVVAGSFLRWLIDPILPGQVAYTIYAASVAVSTRRGGVLGGVAATLFSLFAGTFFFAEPRGRLWTPDVTVLITALLFVLTAAIVIVALELETRARRQVEERDALLQSEYQERMRLERELDQAQRLESLGRLAGGVAHDFNNLLTAILSSLELVRKHLPDDPKITRLIDNAVQGAQRGATLTQRLLAYARRQPLKVQAVDVPQLIEYCSSWAQLEPGPTVRIETSFSGAPLAAITDPSQLETALLNLGVNARDAMPNGGTLRIRTENVRLSSSEIAKNRWSVHPGEYLRIDFSDTGSGMTEEVRRHIFEPFFTTKPAGKGTGLGLASVYATAERHDGVVTVRSELGRGTTFSFYLPIARETTVQPRAHESHPAL